MTWNPLVTVISPTTCERAVLRAQLLGADYNVLTVHGPAGALARLPEGIPHLIIVDHGQAETEMESFRHLMNRLEGAAPLPILYIMDQKKSMGEILYVFHQNTVLVFHLSHE